MLGTRPGRHYCVLIWWMCLFLPARGLRLRRHISSLKQAVMTIQKKKKKGKKTLALNWKFNYCSSSTDWRMRWIFAVFFFFFFAICSFTESNILTVSNAPHCRTSRGCWENVLITSLHLFEKGAKEFSVLLERLQRNMLIIKKFEKNRAKETRTWNVEQVNKHKYWSGAASWGFPHAVSRSFHFEKHFHFYFIFRALPQ